MNPEWVSAIGTVASAVAAVVLGFYSVVLSRREARTKTQEAAKTREAQKRSQASKISCWMQQQTNYPQHHVHVHNASDSPIWSVQVDHGYKSAHPAEFPVIGVAAE